MSELAELVVKLKHEGGAETAAAIRSVATEGAKAEAATDKLASAQSSAAGAMNTASTAAKGVSSSLSEQQKQLQTVTSQTAEYTRAMQMVGAGHAQAAKGLGTLSGAHSAAAQSAKLAGHEMTNLGRQIADVGTMAALGASPMMILASQGAQLADIFAVASARGVTLRAGLMQVASGAAGLIVKFGPMLAIVGAVALGVDMLTKHFKEASERAVENAKYWDELRKSLAQTSPLLDEQSRASDLAAEGQKNLSNWLAESAAKAEGYAASLKNAVIQTYLLQAATAQGKANELRKDNTRKTARGVVYSGLDGSTGADSYQKEQNEADRLVAIAQARAKQAIDAPLQAFLPKAAAAHKERAKGISDEERALKSAREEAARYIESLTEEVATYGQTSIAQKRYASNLQIEAALKRGDLSSAKRIADLQTELETLTKLSDEVNAYADAVAKTAGANITIAPSDLDAAARGLDTAADRARKFAEALEDVSYGVEGVARAFKSGDFSGISRDVAGLVTSLKASFTNGGTLGGLTALGSAGAQLIGGKAGRALGGGLGLAGAGLTLGTYAGTTAGAAALGGLGLSSGAIAGIASAAPIVGAVVGGLYALAKVFNLGGKPTNAGAGYDLISGALSGNKRTSETESAVKQAGDSIAQAQEALKGYGLSLRETITGVVIGSRDKSQIYTSSGKTLYGAVGDPAAAAEVALQAVLSGAEFVDKAQEKLVRSMQAAGKQFDDIAETLAKYKAAQDVITAVNDQILQMTNPQAYALKQVGKAYDEAVKQAKDAYTAGFYTSEQFDALNASLRELNNLQIADVMKSAGGDVIDALTGRLQDAYDAERSAILETRDAYKDAAESLRAAGQKVRDSITATLGPSAQLGVAGNRFRTASSMALSGDLDALKDLPGLGDAFAQASARYAPDAKTNQRNLSEIRRATMAAEEAAGKQVSIAEQQLAALDQTVAGLLQIDKSVLSVRDAVIALKAAKNALATGGNPTQAAVEALAAGGPTAGASDAFNAAAYLAANKDIGKYAAANGLDADAFALQHFLGTGQYEVAAGFRKRGYASGTSFAGPGVSWVGEHGPELMKFRGGEQVSPYRSFSGGGGGDSALANEIRDLRSDMAILLSKVARNTSETARWSKDSREVLQNVAFGSVTLATRTP